jgi:hypothetical protein
MMLGQMTHKDATDAGATDKYLLGQLSEDERDQFEEHFFSCTECSEDVRLTAIFLDNLKEVLKEPYAIRPAKPAPEIMPPPAAARRWFLAPQIGLAAGIALLALTGYQNAVVIPHLHRELAQQEGPQSYPAFFLTETRSEPNVITAGHNEQYVALQFSKVPGRVFAYYRCELKLQDSRTVSSFTVAVPPRGDEWQLRLPVGGLVPGSYTLSVRGAAQENVSELTDLAQYHFRLEFK